MCWKQALGIATESNILIDYSDSERAGWMDLGFPWLITWSMLLLSLTWITAIASKLVFLLTLLDPSLCSTCNGHFSGFGIPFTMIYHVLCLFIGCYTLTSLCTSYPESWLLFVLAMQAAVLEPTLFLPQPTFSSRDICKVDHHLSQA